MNADSYIAEHNLTNSFIDKKFLYQVRPTLPEKKYVGVTNTGIRLYFEETQGSLRNRHYGYKNKVTSWNLIYVDLNGIPQKVNEKWLEGQIIDFIGDFDIDTLKDFLKNNNRRFNALDKQKCGRKSISIWVTDEEYEYVMKFLKKLRTYKDENTQD